MSLDADYAFPAFTNLLVPSTSEVQDISKNAVAKVRTRNFKHIRRLYENHSEPHTSSTDPLELARFEKLTPHCLDPRIWGTSGVENRR